jgi:hypothetical protein
LTKRAVDEAAESCFPEFWRAAPIGGAAGLGAAVMVVKLPDFDQWIDAMAPVVKLELTPEQRVGVKANLKTAAKMAALLERAALKDEAEPAPVYRI